MKRYISLLLVFVMLSVSFSSSAFAFGFDDLFGLGGDDTEDQEETQTEKSAFENAFTGEKVKVKIGKKTYSIHKNFKNAMDEYEEFFDEYVKFLKNPDMLKYADMMLEYAEAMEALEAIEDDEDMTSADLVYYTYIMKKITKKLSQI